ERPGPYGRPTPAGLGHGGGGRAAPDHPAAGVPGAGALVVPGRRGPDGAGLRGRRDRAGGGLRGAAGEEAAGRRAPGRVLRGDLPRQRRAVPRGHRRLRPRHRPQAPGPAVLPAAARALGAVRRRLAAAYPSRL
ncbi:MAG: hypothetical protein AVDCRST_MAG48-969, partial [uncultured Friedmanniella sp.]